MRATVMPDCSVDTDAEYKRITEDRIFSDEPFHITFLTTSSNHINPSKPNGY